MAIGTIDSHVRRALDFYQREDIYFVIAKSTVWPDEENPPLPTPESELEGIISYNILEQKSLIVPDADYGDFDYGPTRWRIVADVDAFEEKSRWIYIMTHFSYDDHPLLSFRQIGLVTGLERKSEVDPGKSNLLPEEVEDPGIVEVIDYRIATYRHYLQRERIDFILEF